MNRKLAIDIEVSPQSDKKNKHGRIDSNKLNQRPKFEDSPDQFHQPSQSQNSVQSRQNASIPSSEDEEFDASQQQLDHQLIQNNLLFNHQISKSPFIQAPTFSNHHNNTQYFSNHRNQESRLSGEKEVENDEVARIVAKVLKKQSVKYERYNDIQGEKIDKLERINKDLLSENTKLMNRINQLNKKLKKSQKQKEGNKVETKTQSLLASMKERIEKAQKLNSKLNSRLVTEKSKSQLGITTFRKSEIPSPSIAALSTVRSQQFNQDRVKHYQKIQKSGKQLECPKCKHEFKADNNNSIPLFESPILQFKQYEIMGRQKLQQPIKQFILKRPQVVSKSVEVQINMDQVQLEKQWERLKEEQDMLEEQIERNNMRIKQYEQNLYSLINQF